MQVLEKILEDIRGLEKILITDPMKLMVDMGEVEDIIRKHVSGKDTGVPTNDGWIPADEVLPEAGEHVLVSFRSAGFLPATAIISENGRWLRQLFRKTEDGICYKARKVSMMLPRMSLLGVLYRSRTARKGI